ncbi:MAG: hypothetical protein J6J86_04125 [Lachnospiraceae bacterium]|nr:hypothetical protein [Lachnospiraceae bacterium]
MKVNEAKYVLRCSKEKQEFIVIKCGTFIAGYTATNKAYGLLECSATSVGLACCTFFAQNYGAGKHARVKQGVRTALKIVCDGDWCYGLYYAYQKISATAILGCK